MLPGSGTNSNWKASCAWDGDAITLATHGPGGVTPVTLTPGTYWLSLHNGDYSYDANQDFHLGDDGQQRQLRPATAVVCRKVREIGPRTVLTMLKCGKVPGSFSLITQIMSPL